MKTTKRPWVVLNAAMTVDGKIDTAARKGAKISSDGDWVRVDRLRAEFDAVMVGSGTLIGEDPRLTIKSADLRQERAISGRPENPAKVGIISVAELLLDGRFLNDGGAQVFVFTTGKTSGEQVVSLRGRGVDVVVGKSELVDLVQAMGYLKEKGIDRLLLEGGGTLNAAMLTAGLVDEIRVYIAPLVFGGADAPTLADGSGLTRDKALMLELKNVEKVDEGGILLTYLVPSNT